MSDDAIEAKRKELIVGLAADTGVSTRDVEKVLERLGLTNALTNRQHVESTAHRYGLGEGRVLRLSNVNLKNIRIAAGDKAE
jgi:hypothetical protein